MAGLLDRVKVSTATTGTGTVTLGGATTPYRTWAAAAAISGVSYSYLIEDGTAWELGWGIYSSTGPTLTRNLISSSTGSLLNLSGSATVACVANEMDIAPLTPVPQVAGNYLSSDTVGFSTGTTALVANGVYMVPFSRLAKVDAVALEVTTAVASSNVRGGLYTFHPTTGAPHLLIEEGAMQSSATTGIKVMTFAAARWIDRPVYIAIHVSAAITVRGGTAQNTLTLGSNTLNTATPYTRYSGTSTFGPLPADASSLTLTLSGTGVFGGVVRLTA